MLACGRLSGCVLLHVRVWGSYDLFLNYGRTLDGEAYVGFEAAAGGGGGAGMAKFYIETTTAAAAGA